MLTRVFDGMPTRNLVSWDALMPAVSDAGLPRRGVELLQECLALGMVPDEAMLVTGRRTVHGLAVALHLSNTVRHRPVV